MCAYRFNNGHGGVTCDQCNILFDADLSYKEYEESYGETGHDGDFCVNCLSKIRVVLEGKDDILNDGWRN